MQKNLKNVLVFPKMLQSVKIVEFQEEQKTLGTFCMTSFVGRCFHSLGHVVNFGLMRNVDSSHTSRS